MTLAVAWVAAAVHAAAECAQPAGNCWQSMCCEQPPWAPVYGCFKRRGRDFAQCRPIYGWNSTGDHMENIPSRGRQRLKAGSSISPPRPPEMSLRQSSSTEPMHSTGSICESEFWSAMVRYALR